MTDSDVSHSAPSDRFSSGVTGEWAGPTSIVVVDDDDLFRETLGLRLTDLGYAVTSFSGGLPVVEHFASGGRADIVLLDWHMPGLDGLEVLRRLHRLENVAPVIVLTGREEDEHEVTALDNGAADFVPKSRSFSVLVKRLRLIAEGARPTRRASGWRGPAPLHLGRLELSSDSNRATWAGKAIALTAAEFRVVSLLAMRCGDDVSYREIYELVRAGDAMTRCGDDACCTNVRGMIKRIRNKFRDADPEFDGIQNYAGFGYRWTS